MKVEGTEKELRSGPVSNQQPFFRVGVANLRRADIVRPTAEIIGDSDSPARCI